jgi:hypothetical protein
MAMQRRLHQILQDAQLPQSEHPQEIPLQIHLFHRGAELMPGHSPWVRRRLQKF